MARPPKRPPPARERRGANATEHLERPIFAGSAEEECAQLDIQSKRLDVQRKRLDVQRKVRELNILRNQPINTSRLG